jgi:UDP-N-acetylmuramate dehydrogenase
MSTGENSEKIEILENVDLSNYTSMKIGGTAKYFTIVETESDIKNAYEWAQLNNLKIFPLGGGSNTIFSEKKHDYLFILIKNSGILKSYESDQIINIDVSAGENWDGLVAWTIKNNLKGLECLSGIPGTVGAGPIQNIGAYGSEIRDTLTKVKILDIESGQISEISNNECDFDYRDSVFKKNLGKFIILLVSFSLQKAESPQTIPQYKDIQLYFLDKKQKAATISKIREAVLEIRGNKIPWPADIPNCGSFFKNPIVSNSVAGKIAREYPEIPYFKIDEETTKLYAGWMIEKVLPKGFEFDSIKIDKKNSLVLINPGGKADFNQLEKAVKEIQDKIYKKFKIKLEIEPNIID